MESINLTDYVPFDIAQCLTAKGFDVETEKSYFVGDGEKRYVKKGTFVNSPSNAPHLIAAPTVQMANQFLREKYHLHISIGFTNYGYSWHIINCEYGNCYSHGLKGGFKTAEDANIDALNICLTDIIK